MARRQRTRCRFIKVCSREIESTPFVQQPCSNLRECRENSRKAF
jgi:hypothetical protein